jgi:phosphoribosylformylglycinamidine synthase
MSKLLTAAKELALTDFEYNEIVRIIGREPTLTELGMFSVMWSEHCSYKHSRPILKLFKKYKDAIEGEGLENAGVVPIGYGYGLVMKMESHNHPSAVEPYQGAATGVGGILRDIFTMGARPIASLNSLRFGPLSDAHTRYLFEGVVAGIGGYGNCVGVPTVGGEIYFHPSYSENPLVNAMAVGLVKLDGRSERVPLDGHYRVEYAGLASAAAKGTGNPVYLIGSSTGKDGIAGASFASVELDEDSEARRPNVQIGDPFTEKLLIEATLAAIDSGAVVGIQDMGAAGVTCSTCETAAKGGVGLDVDLDKLPLRDSTMTSFEIMLSESQERMLAIVDKDRAREVEDIVHFWGLNCAKIGEVAPEGNLRIYYKGELVCNLPAKLLADESPTYEIPDIEPEYIKHSAPFPHGGDVGRTPGEDGLDAGQALLKLLASPNIASKRWVYRQYDKTVQTNTVLTSGAEAAVLRIRNTPLGIALTTDCNSRYCYWNPKLGAQIAVAEACRNLACVGAHPIALTDCLNFGNPEKPDVAWQFRRCVEGIAEAAELFGCPVISGNVSFYNEGVEAAVYPTPVVGVAGLIPDVACAANLAGPFEGDLLFLLGDPCPADASLGAAEFQSVILEAESGPVPALGLQMEAAVQFVTREAVRAGLVSYAKDCSEGGIGVAIGELCIAKRTGGRFSLPSNGDAKLLLFNEAQSRILLAVKPSCEEQLLTLAAEKGIPCAKLGNFAGNFLEMLVNGEICLTLNCSQLAEAYESAIPNLMKSS